MSQGSRAFPLPREGGLRGIVIATVAVLVADVGHIFGIKFARLVHSDAACTVLIAARALEARLPVAPNWYFANGDVWVWGPQLWAMLPVALMGAGVGSLRITNAFGFALELLAVRHCFGRLTRRPWVAVLAAAATLLAISKIHVLFAYVELAYGFTSTTYLLAFTWLMPPTASSTKTASAPTWHRWIAGSVLLFVYALDNPARVLVLGLAPLWLVSLWPWRGIGLRPRAMLASLAAIAWAAAFAVYKFGLLQSLTFSPHPGHTDFVIQGPSGIVANVKMLLRGLVVVVGGDGELDALAIPGLVVVGGAFAFVAWNVLARRTLTRDRFLCVATLAQLGAALVPCLVGNLLLNPLSARYIVPAILPMMGLAVVLAVRVIGRGRVENRTPTAIRGARLATAWLVLLPVVGAIEALRTSHSSMEGANLQWANRANHAVLASELTRRGLRHGFATYWNANLVTLLANERTKTCPVFVGDEGIVPQKWNIDTSCFDRARLPGTIYVVAAAEERALVAKAIAIALPPPVERFMVGESFEVTIFDITSQPLRWLDLPLPVGAALRFPLHISALNPSVRRAAVSETADGLAATGDEGTLVYGPYLRLPKGAYRVRWIGTGESSVGGVLFDVSIEGGREVVAVRKRPAAELAGIRHGEVVSLDFDLPKDTAGVELRIFGYGGATLAVHEAVVEKR